MLLLPLSILNRIKSLFPIHYPILRLGTSLAKNNIDSLSTSSSKLVSVDPMNLDPTPDWKDPQEKFQVPENQINRPTLPLLLPQDAPIISDALELASSAGSNPFLSNPDSQTNLQLASSLPSFKSIRDGSGVCWKCSQRKNEEVYFATCDDDDEHQDCSQCESLLSHRESGFITWH